MLRDIDTAVAAGCSLEDACAQAGVSTRTVHRWRSAPGEGDRRQGPHHKPRNGLTDAERVRVLDTLNSAEFRDCSPKQVVPRLADRGEYIGSESTMYRILREEEQLAHREPSRPRVPRPVPTHVAAAPDEVYSWDITYLRGPVRGTFFFLYLFMDIWSRKIVGYSVEEEENSDELAASIFERACAQNGVDPRGIVLHSDNGGAMKGSTMLAKLQDLGVLPSFSRPGVSDDNAFSEALFRTIKFRPGYPGTFASRESAQAWVAAFVEWYNHEHRHSAIRYVTPAERHAGEDIAILARRHAVYERARRRRPERWSGPTRNWTPPELVRLNSRKEAT